MEKCIFAEDIYMEKCKKQLIYLYISLLFLSDVNLRKVFFIFL